MDALAGVDLDVNQGTVSRELASLGATKVDGFYRLPAPPQLPAQVHRIDFTAGDCLAVIHTDAAFASVLGQFLDDREIRGLLGTIAGDDTVFVALGGPEAADRLCRTLGLPRTRRSDG